MKGQCVIDRGDGSPPTNVPSAVHDRLTAGTILRVDTSGGSGYGDPRHRDHQLVTTDVQNGYISRIGERDYEVRVLERADGALAGRRRNRSC